ncbi:DUF4190 domain-containing protein [Microbacterium sp. NPDC055910]|uniref:DUF4190 domain-containing protein n=1 Tax=Microbacterium sp. NPDC055910 TaxID=3345659 RepID=UPI0035DA8D05
MSTPENPSNDDHDDARPTYAPPAYTPPPAYSAPPAYTPPAEAPAPPAADAPPQAPGAYPAYGGYAQPQYPSAPAYGAPAGPYGAAPAYGYAAVKTNVLAIISMIASIAGFIWILPFVGSLAGAIMGHISLKQIARTGEKGRGMALAGVIVGWVGLAFLVLGVLFFLAFIPFAATQSSFR